CPAGRRRRQHQSHRRMIRSKKVGSWNGKFDVERSCFLRFRLGTSNFSLSMQPLTAAMPAALAQLLHAIPLSTGKVDFAWNVAVGPALQKISSVRLDGSILVVEADGQHWAREISRAAHIILPRLQALLGEGTVTRIEVRRLQP